MTISMPLAFLLIIMCLPILYKLYTVSFHQPHLEHISVKHLAIIMDGNRRWAKKHNQLSQYGHNQGIETLRWLIRYCIERKIEMVSVYAWSLENFKRDPEEVNATFKLMVEKSEKALPEMMKNGVKIRFIGDRNCFPESVRSTIDKLESSTKNGTQLQLNILFCYGGKQEILSAVNSIINDVKAGKLKDVPSEEIFKKYLWTEDIPDPDLIIRTGGVKRLSNFLTYQTAYSELYFTDRFWPEITTKDLDAALREYALRKRNFGK